jgi:hypothetical protein
MEDPSKMLFSPYGLGHHTRKIVVENGKIVDRQYVKKRAKIEGEFTERLERKIESKPWQYLIVDVKDGSVVYCRDMLGIVNCQKPERLTDAVSYKESYACLLGRKAQDILLSYSLL